MTSTSSTPQSFFDRQRDAALAEIVEQRREFQRVAELVIPSDPRRRNTSRVTNVIRLGDDHLVEVTDQDNRTRWTFVVGERTTSWYHHRQEDAILHLIAARYDGNPNSNYAAAFYAGRVLGVPAEPEEA
ncbi:hypothetical protein E1211_17995 [Micromonospora sp. 15K316]|uniref:hypothetical protein n=1 Tax=Micromonospora sp. 15K316 TaxID=2530376 RepID=UPI00104B64DE|nr:hypothetical protein [Micromonospora sp. 15K316]TDC34239.1 hypothetical protein E1211_17995 [Micromonospora sp. 15K316]